MESRPAEITEDDHEKGMDMQGLSWGIGDIPVKEDFREKRYNILPLQGLTIESKIMDH
jgi:hypothetical protein